MRLHYGPHRGNVGGKNNILFQMSLKGVGAYLIATLNVHLHLYVFNEYFMQLFLVRAH